MTRHRTSRTLGSEMPVAIISRRRFSPASSASALLRFVTSATAPTYSPIFPELSLMARVVGRTERPYACDSSRDDHLVPVLEDILDRRLEIRKGRRELRQNRFDTARPGW